MNAPTDKKQRVREELLRAGVTLYGLSKSESQALHDHIGDDEHILGVIYGQFEATSAMMVATDLRMLFIDIRAMHNIIEETSYDSFGDLNVDEGIAFSRVTLRTKPREYVFRMVNRKCARNFINVIEEMAVDQNSEQSMKLRSPHIAPTFEATGDEITFLMKHHVATLSSRSAGGYPYGATVYYVYTSEHPDDIFFTTKSSTTSAENIRKSPKVAFTITDFDTMTTMHVQGIAEIEKQADLSNKLINMLFQNKSKLAGAGEPPITKIKQGSFIVYRVRISGIRVRTYL